MWTNGIRKPGKDSRCQESGEEIEARKTEIAMGGCFKSDIEKVREDWKNYR